MKTVEPELLSYAEAAALLSVGQTKIRELITLHKIKPVKLPGMSDPRYRRADLLAMVLFEGEGDRYLLPYEPYVYGGKFRHPQRIALEEAAEIREYGMTLMQREALRE